MDEVDRAQEQIESDLARHLAAALAARMTSPSPYCRECGDDLMPHRKPFGICIDCKTAEERKAGAYAKARAW